MLSGTQLSHEFQAYNATTGAITAWVKIPTLQYDTDTTIYLGYGNSTVSASMEDINNVWTAYAGAYHLEGSYDGTAGEVKDSKGTNNGVATAPTVQTTGKVDYGQDFQANADYIDLGDMATYDNATSLSMEFWYYPDTNNVGDSILRKWAGANAQFYLAHNGAGDAGELEAGVYDGSNILQSDTDALNLTTQWYHITCVWDATADAFDWYVDGATEAHTDSGAGGVTDLGTGAERLFIGARYNGGSPDLHIDGKMDEVRLSTTKLTQSWAITNFNTQNSPSTFYSFTAVAGAGISASRRLVNMS